MVHMRYGSALGSLGEHRYSPIAPNRTSMHLGAFGEHLCSSNIANPLP